MTTRIRPIERDDALSLGALRLQQDREVGHTPRPGFLTDYADALLADFDGVRGWIAEEPDGRPVGCVLALRVRKLPTLSHLGRPEWWYVQQVFVSADRRREGLGRRLLHAVQEAATAERVRFVRLNASDAGRPLFDATGFDDPTARLREWVPRQV
ncbi:GNAT family N-acetyltransferase [Janibacter sp. CX7]|uniref:GNAT family N-acetyltransferase n=1 Tax=Janibacter sp. CX7 TaxID=2963431 RepID=UPI0020CE5CA3|nr:GNAT family N-acetyltransferase [Janibacter sp. CX7]UTT67499.1 GNAT family N-acetyltransferase [Janibacter sp. CX7]